jgi:hypothetical protein
VTAPTTLEYLRVIRARKWVVVLAVLLGPSVAVFFSLRPDRSRRMAALLANRYASEFTLYERELTTAEIDAALADVQRRIDELTAARQRQGAVNLTGKLLQLQTMGVHSE